MNVHPPRAQHNSGRACWSPALRLAWLGPAADAVGWPRVL